MLKRFLVCLGIAVIVTGCSSGGTNTSIGLNLTGTWQGVIRSTSTGRSATITLSLTQPADSGDVTGVATFGPTACMTGGAVTGTVAGQGINLTVSSTTSELTMGGQFVAENQLTGTWFNVATAQPVVANPAAPADAAGGAPADGDGATAARFVDLANTACSGEAGNWSVGRGS